jgi:predicted dehydrogenase
MSQSLRAAIAGGGWPGTMHAAGYAAAGGWAVTAVADPIPQRRAALAAAWPKARQLVDADELVRDPGVDAISICLPTHLHAATATAALRAGKHVIIEPPPGLGATEAKRLAAAATKYNRTLAYAFQRRFGAAEMASSQAIAKGYAGDPYHVRATWMRSRGVPAGTDHWYTDVARAGGGALADLGLHMLDLGWHLLGRPAPTTVFAVTHHRFADAAPGGPIHDVEDAAFALITFEGGRSLELGVSWAINQSPGQNGTTCRVYGTAGAVEVYTPKGPVLYRPGGKSTDPKPTPLKQPAVVGHTAMLRQFREAVHGRARAAVDGEQGVVLMQMVEALYRSAQTGRSADVRLAKPDVATPGEADALPG